MIPTIDVTKGAVLTMNVVDDGDDDDEEDIDDEMAEDENEEDDFWLGKLGEFLKPCRPVFKGGNVSEEKPKQEEEGAKMIEEVDEKMIPVAPEPKVEGKPRSQRALSESKQPEAQQCPLCTEPHENLNRHIKDVHGIEGVVCPHCSKILAKNCTLSRHIEQVHFNLQIHKPAKCDQCEKVFSKKGHLDRHVKTIHLGMKEESNPCPHCGKTFSTKSSLEPHIMMVHQGIRKKCPECGKVLSDLWKHMRTMHGKYRRKAKISKEEAINMNLVPNSGGKIDLTDVNVARTVPMFTDGDQTHKIEYVKVQSDAKEPRPASVLKPKVGRAAAPETNKRKSFSPVKLRLPLKSKRLSLKVQEGQHEAFVA